MARRSYSQHAAIGAMLLLGIVGLLLSVRPFGNQVENSRHTKVQADISSITTQLKLYEKMNGFFPTTEQTLQALIVQPDSDPKPSHWMQLFPDMPKDPWQSDYVYRCPGTQNPNGYDLFSAGPDRKPDTGDDDWGQ